MIILVINSGSSSIKYQLFEGQGMKALAAGLVEKIGEPSSRVKHSSLTPDEPVKRTLEDIQIRNHRQGLSIMVEMLMDDEIGVIDSPMTPRTPETLIINGISGSSQDRDVPEVSSKAGNSAPGKP